MHLSRLKLVNFRGFRNLEFALPMGPAILLGSNAQGKTTLLEAVYLLAISKSFRAENEREVVNWEAAAALQPAAVDGVVLDDADQRTRIIVGYQPYLANRGRDDGQAPTHSVRKTIKVGGVRRTAADLLGLINAVLFSADDIRLAQGSPSVRRRFLDILISQSDSRYLRSLQRYQRTLHQRNQLLKLIREGRAGPKELAFWDRQLIDEGSVIIQRRGKTMASLAEVARETLQELTGGAEELELVYRPSVAPGPDAGATAQRFESALDGSRPRETVMGATSLGPHRDDFAMLVNGVDMGPYASRGQARTLALTLRLSEAHYLRSFKGEPLVLLDDILSELDAQRRAQTLERMLNYRQVIITATDLEPFSGEFLRKASVYRVEEWGVVPQRLGEGAKGDSAARTGNGGDG